MGQLFVFSFICLFSYLLIYLNWLNISIQREDAHMSTHRAQRASQQRSSCAQHIFSLSSTHPQMERQTKTDRVTQEVGNNLAWPGCGGLLLALRQISSSGSPSSGWPFQTVNHRALSPELLSTTATTPRRLVRQHCGLAKH